MFEFHPLNHPKGFQMAMTPRVRAAGHRDWHNPRLSQGLLGLSRVLPLPEVPFSGLFSPEDGTALTTLGSWVWRGSFGRLETPWTGNGERLSCSLPWQQHHRHCQDLLFWGQAPSTEDKSSHFPAGRGWQPAECADIGTHTLLPEQSDFCR